MVGVEAHDSSDWQEGVSGVEGVESWVSSSGLEGVEGGAGGVGRVPLCTLVVCVLKPLVIKTVSQGRQYVRPEAVRWKAISGFSLIALICSEL